MSKTTTSNPRVKAIFDDLDSYRDFCRWYGYKFDENDLYSTRSYAYRQYQKLQAGKYAKNQWEIDLAKYKERESKPNHNRNFKQHRA